jgi:biotin synthase
MKIAESILQKSSLSREDIIYLLLTKDPEERKILFSQANRVAKKYCGKHVNLRGLIELSNICKKNCYYCGIRRGNKHTERYLLNTSLVLEAAEYAWKKGFGSIVIQSGERSDRAFTSHITDLLRQIRLLSNNELGITLSCGEQSPDIYREWFKAGAHRYLLRIESSNRSLYKKLHPHDENHDFDKRIQALADLKEAGYQVGTGVMIGLPYQSIENLADDLLFMQRIDIDMAGMGPYIPHPDTPLYHRNTDIPSVHDRMDLSLKMIALLRIMMKDINIAASTAMNALDPHGRLKAITSGANVFMPNITPALQACNYMLYEGKPIFSDMAESALVELENDLEDLDFSINYKHRGDAKHYFNRIKNSRRFK